MDEPFFHVRNARVWQGDSIALHDISLSLHHGESVAILGANGAGKSTLLKLMTGELRAEARAGTLCRLLGEERWCLEEIRHRIGIVIPEEVVRFHPNEQAVDVVLTAFRGAYGRTNEMRFHEFEKLRAADIIFQLGITALVKRKFSTLSSGEKRRFLIARALVHKPEVFVLDEPSTALDFASKIHLMNAMRSIASSGSSLILVTHDPSEIPPEITRLILLKKGKLFADGSTKDVLTSSILSDLFELELTVSWMGSWPIVKPISRQ